MINTAKMSLLMSVNNGENVSWRERLTDIAKVLHKEDQAKTSRKTMMT